MTMRPDRLLAIARRDLRMELGGRRGWILPAVVVALLLPVSSAPRFGPTRVGPDTTPAMLVSGDVPQEVADLSGVTQIEGGGIEFSQETQLEVRAPLGLPPAIREVLDAQDPAPVPVVILPRQIPVPGRTLLFALISASTLTGALSASVGGERSARTLVALLSASVSRAEVVVGKWLAWSGFGVASSLMAALAAIVMGRVEIGPWLAPMVCVPMCAVALGLWLVRRASDVIGGTTVTLRVLPAVIALTGLAAWFIGARYPLVGAAVPLGGALIAAGAAWGESALPALVATLSTGACIAWLLAATARDLHEVVGQPTRPSPTGLTLRTGVIAAGLWWPALLGPLLWAAAGNAAMTETLSTQPAMLASGMGLLLLTLGHLTGKHEGRPTHWLSGASVGHWGLAVAIGLALAALTANPLTPLPEAVHPMQLRLHEALAPGHGRLGAAITAVLGTELLFRGWLQERAGWMRSTAAWIAVCCPFDPVLGLVSGIGLGALTHRSGSVGPALLAHAVWAVL